MGRADRLGTGLSLACAVHCAALPVLGAFAGWRHLGAPAGVWLEVALIGGAALIGIFTLGRGYRQHGRVLPLMLLAAGLMSLALGHLEPFHAAESAAGVTGAVLLLAAQWSNRRLAATCCTGHTALS